VSIVPAQAGCADEETIMDDNDRHTRGMNVRRKVLGNAWVDKQNAGKTPFNSEFQEMITRNVWGEIWTRPHYDERTRRVLVIGTMMALGKWDEFKLHVRAAFNNGVTRDEIKEVLLHCAIYAGVPAANSAFHMAEEVFAQLDAKPASVRAARTCSLNSSQAPSAIMVPMTRTRRVRSS